MYNPVTGIISVVNNAFEVRDVMLVAKVIDMKGKVSVINETFVLSEPVTVKQYTSLKTKLAPATEKEGCFLSLQLLDMRKNIVAENTYWLPDGAGNYSGLQKMGQSSLIVEVKQVKSNQIKVVLTNSDHAPLSFFNRISVVNKDTHLRILPIFIMIIMYPFYRGLQKIL